jgi:hypothetical protein
MAGHAKHGTVRDTNPTRRRSRTNEYAVDFSGALMEARQRDVLASRFAGA